MASKAALGVIKIGPTPTVVGELRNWRQPMDVTEIDTTIMGNDKSRFIPGKQRDTVQVDLFFQPEDAGQALVLTNMAKDTPIAVELYPWGEGGTTYFWSANAYVMGGEVTGDADGAIEFTGITFSSDENGGTWAAQPGP